MTVCIPPTMAAHWRRWRMTLRGEWKREYQQGRKSPVKRWHWLPGRLSWIPEISHATKNLWVEWLRLKGWWDRPQRPENRCLGYDFPD